jgi:hypothetical protein
MLRGSLQWEFLKYTKFIGQKTSLSFESASYLTGHRLELRWRNITAGAYEILSYSRDEIEWSYALPFVSLFIAEHMVGDRDNVAMGFDLQYVLMNKCRVFLEIFLDDLVGPLELFKDFRGNKTAYVIGAEAPDLAMQNSNIRLEYSRIVPWVYSHDVPDNQLQHLGATLGSGIPPNSQSVNVCLTKYLLSGFEISTAYGLYQHQHNDRGSSLFDVFQEGDPPNREFLGSNFEFRHTADLLVNYKWRHYIETAGLLGYHYTGNWRSSRDLVLKGIRLGLSIFLRY